MNLATVARNIKKVVKNHEALAAADGDLMPNGVSLQFDSGLSAAIKAICAPTKTISNSIIAWVNHNPESIIEALTSDNARDAKDMRVALHAARTITSLANSTRTLQLTKFQNRVFCFDDLGDVMEVEQFREHISDSASILQFRRVGTEGNELTYNWAFMVDGQSVGRGTNATYHKLITALLKLIKVPALQSDSAVQAEVAKLAALKGEARKYYWYLSNKDTAHHYRAFEHFGVSSSCMSKEADYYNYTGRGQHPMDCYDDSPDWRLMFWSTMSPDEINEMCDEAIRNPDMTSFKYPWLTRCMVLPAHKEKSGRGLAGPYLFGKMYGNDKLLNYFYEGSNTYAGNKHDNPFLTNAYAFDGGRIKTIQSTYNEEYYLLPYYDRANLAALVMDADGSLWWEAVRDPNSGRNIPGVKAVAGCSYQKGVANFIYFKSPSHRDFVRIDSFKLTTFPTIFGDELQDYCNRYQDITVNGQRVSVPNSMITDYEGNQVFKGLMVNLFDGSLTTVTAMEASPERFQTIDGLGIFDLNNANHLAAYTQLNQSNNKVDGQPMVSESPLFATGG